MREVSCSALGALFAAAKKRPGAEETLLVGVPHDIAYLRNQKNRLDWDVWCRILSNARELWSLSELSDLNESFTRSPMFAYVGLIARLLFTSRDLYDWICKRSVGAGNQLFTCVKASYEHVGTETTVIQLEIDPAYQASPEFLWMTRGAFIAMPRLVGSGDASVSLTVDGHVGTYTVRYRNKRGTVAGLWRAVTFPFTARRTAKELQSTNERLHERFYELEDARMKLTAQATRLRAAHAISDVVHGDLHLASTASAIARSLVVEAGFSWAEIVCQQQSALASFGNYIEGAHRLEVELGVTDAPIGRVRLQCRNVLTPERRELVAFL